MKHAGKYSFGIVLIGISLMGMSNGRNNRNSRQEPTPTPVPVETPVPTPTPTPFPTPCPTSMSAAGMTQWRDSVAGALGSVLNENSVGAWVRSCFPQTAQLPACVQRLDKYTRRRAGNSIEDADYRSDPHRRLPDELLVSGSNDFNYVLRGDIEEHAKELGWPVGRYKSRHAGGFDSNTPSLLMIEVPGAMLNPPVNFDRYINIALIKDDNEDGTNPTPQKHFPEPAVLAADSNGSYPHVTTMVTVERGTRDSKARLYFQMFNRSGSVYRPSSPNNPSGCVSCHPSGLRAISPLGYHVRAGEAQLDPANWAQVKRINSDMVAGQRGGITWGSRTESNGSVTPTLDTASFGPVMGPSEPLSENTRTKEFIVGADGNSGCQNSRSRVDVTDIFGRAPGRNNVYTFTSSPPVDWQKVADAMDCQMCHNNEKQGVLNELTSQAQVDFKILVDQSMPNGMHKNPLDQGSDPSTPVVDELNPNERLALANCLNAEWQLERTKVKQWLQEVPCAGGTAKNFKHGTAERLPAAKTKKHKKKSLKKAKKKKSPKAADPGSPAGEKTE